MHLSVDLIWWNNRGELLNLRLDSEMYAWDAVERRWKDDGGYGSELITGDQSNRYPD